MDFDAKILTILAVIFLVSCPLIISTIPDDEPIIVINQSGFEIEIDNNIMIAACEYHGLDYNDIRYDTVNETFIFIRNDKTCYVFTNGFREYYLEKIEEIEEEKNKKEGLK